MTCTLSPFISITVIMKLRIPLASHFTRITYFPEQKPGLYFLQWSLSLASIWGRAQIGTHCFYYFGFKGNEKERPSGMSPSLNTRIQGWTHARGPLLLFPIEAQFLKPPITGVPSPTYLQYPPREPKGCPTVVPTSFVHPCVTRLRGVSQIDMFKQFVEFHICDIFDLRHANHYLRV